MAERRRRLSAGALALVLAATGGAGLAACGDDGGDEPGRADQPARDGDDGDDGDDDGDDDRVDEGRDGGGDDSGDSGDDGAAPASEPVEVDEAQRPYADVLVDASVASGQTPEQAECQATRTVDLLGAELTGSGLTPDQFAEDPAAVLAGAVDRDLAEELYDVMAGCGTGYRDVLLDQMASEADLGSAARACLEDVFTDDVVRQVFVDTMLAGEGGAPLDPQLTAAAEACAGDGG